MAGSMRRLAIPVIKLHPEARLPRCAHSPDEDAGMDLFAVEEVTLPAGGWRSVGTGLAIELPPGCEGQIRPRSGLAQRSGVTVLNSPGTIDPGYRGEIRVLMINHGKADYTVRPGDRIAQLLVGSYAAVDWIPRRQLAASHRGPGGFGSSGE